MEATLKISQKIKTRPPYDPAISCLAIYPENSIPYCKSICTPTSMAALFTIAKKTRVKLVVHYS